MRRCSSAAIQALSLQGLALGDVARDRRSADHLAAAPLIGEMLSECRSFGRPFGCGSFRSADVDAALHPFEAAEDIVAVLERAEHRNRLAHGSAAE